MFTVYVSDQYFIFSLAFCVAPRLIRVGVTWSKFESLLPPKRVTFTPKKKHDHVF
jgi:hypothetical protein